MSAIVIEHVDVKDLPDAWRARLPVPAAERVTVRIEEESGRPPAEAQHGDAIDLLFGMWRDREDMADVASYVRKLRASRFNDGGARRGA